MIASLIGVAQQLLQLTSDTVKKYVLMRILLKALRTVHKTLDEHFGPTFNGWRCGRKKFIWRRTKEKESN